ncbi:heparin-sulfate lyase HepC [Alistipes timonensis]
MKMKLLRLSVFVAGIAFVLTGCLSDDTIVSTGGSSTGGAYEPSKPGNDEVSAEAFSVLNLDYPGMENVKRDVEAGELGAASLALRDYYRYNSGVNNPLLNLLSVTSISDTELTTANEALFENGYRFKVSTFVDSDGRPYSYLNAAGDGIDWTLHADGDQELRGQLHRHQWFVPQAKAYYVTKDEKYINSWMSVYDDWWKNHPAPESYPENNQPKQFIGWVPLSVAARVQDMCSLMDYYRWADAFKPAALTRFVERLAFQVGFIKNNYWSDSNHRISQAQAVTLAGLLFPEMKQASEWVTNGSTILNEEIVKQYFADGWLKDNDLHYHIGSIESFRSAMVVAEANGQTDRFPSDYIAAMRKMVEVEKYLIYPNYAVYNKGNVTDAGYYNYSTPNFGDTRPSSWTRNILLRHMRNYRDLFPDDQEFKWLASQGAEGKMPPTGIKCFEDGGHYTIRNGWTKDATMMVLVNAVQTPKEAWHRQWDNNNFELYINGRQFFPDSGVFSYGGTSAQNASRNTYARTDYHSTMTLGNANVTSCRGVCRLAEERGDYDLLVLENPSYAGLTHRRSVWFVDHKFFVILDEGYGTAEGTVNLNFHLLPGMTPSEVVVDAAENGAHTAFADGNNLLVRTFANKAVTTTARTGYVSLVLDVTTERPSYQVDLAKSAGDKAARFITVLYPASDASAETVSAEFIDEEFSETAARISVTAGGQTYRLSYTLEPKN